MKSFAGIVAKYIKGISFCKWYPDIFEGCWRKQNILKGIGLCSSNVNTELYNDLLERYSRKYLALVFGRKVEQSFGRNVRFVSKAKSICHRDPTFKTTI